VTAAESWGTPEPYLGKIEKIKFRLNIILVNLLDSDWLKTVPIKH
jgi:hypothetical protein